MPPPCAVELSPAARLRLRLLLHYDDRRFLAQSMFFGSRGFSSTDCADRYRSLLATHQLLRSPTHSGKNWALLGSAQLGNLVCRQQRRRRLATVEIRGWG